MSAVQQHRREIEGTARALQSLAAGIAEAAGDPNYVAINAFRASLAVLSLRGQAERLAVAKVERDRIKGIIDRAAAATHPSVVEGGAIAVIRAFDFWFSDQRLEDLGVDRRTALIQFSNAVALSAGEGGKQ